MRYVEGIDIRRLAEDHEYWEMVAPAESTHCRPSHAFKHLVWYRLENGVLYIYDGKCKGGLGVAHTSKLNEPAMIVRPAKQEPQHEKGREPGRIAQEWNGEGLPPVGEECGMTLGFAVYDRVKITYMGDGVFCYRNIRNDTEYTGSLADATFSPIQTREQRMHQELTEVIRRTLKFLNEDEPIDFVSDSVAVEVQEYLSKYTLTPKAKA